MGEKSLNECIQTPIPKHTHNIAKNDYALFVQLVAKVFVLSFQYDYIFFD